MEDNRDQPVIHANKLYSIFLLTFDETAADRFSLLEKSNYQFSMFLEDSLVNDKVVNEYSPSDLNAFISTMLLLHGMSNYVILNRRPRWNIDVFCQQWYEGLSTKDVLIRYASRQYLISNKKELYAWKKSHWEQWEESEVHYNPSYTDFRLTPFRPDFSTPEVEEAYTWACDKLEECRLEAATFDRKNLIKAIWKNPIVMNQKNLVPFQDQVYDLDNRTIRRKCDTDFFSIKLPYQPVKYMTKFVEDFFHPFTATAKEEISTAILRMFNRDVPSLICIIGGPNTGKTTIANVAYNMLGPFAVRLPHCPFYFDDQVDYSTVRTCFYDDDVEAFFDEEFIENHPCKNVVVVCTETPDIGMQFGGRQVYRINLSKPAKNIIPCIEDKLSTRLQLGSLFEFISKHAAKDNSLNIVPQVDISKPAPLPPTLEQAPSPPSQ